MSNESDGYTVLIQDNFSGDKVQLTTDVRAMDVLDAVARAMVALTFSEKLVRQSMRQMSKESK